MSNFNTTTTESADVQFFASPAAGSPQDEAYTSISDDILAGTQPLPDDAGSSPRRGYIYLVHKRRPASEREKSMVNIDESAVQIAEDRNAFLFSLNPKVL